MAEGPIQYKLLLPAELKRQIEQEAADANRSLSAEIVLRLEESLRAGRREKELIDAFMRRDAMIADLVERLERSDPEFAATRAKSAEKAEAVYRRRAEEAKKLQPAKTPKPRSRKR